MEMCAQRGCLAVGGGQKVFLLARPLSQWSHRSSQSLSGAPRVLKGLLWCWAGKQHTGVTAADPKSPSDCEVKKIKVKK